MAWTAEQKRGRRAQRKRDRAADDERRGVKRKPRGRPPLYHRWDGSAGAWVLDEAVETLERRQLELPPLTLRPDDLNAWAAANPRPRRCIAAGTRALAPRCSTRAVETLERQQLELPPLSSHPDDLNAWAAANPPPCRDDFATQELFDAAREPWYVHGYVLLMGTRLPPYGQNAKRAKAWGRACKRHSERSASHRFAQERAEKLDIPPQQSERERHGESVCVAEHGCGIL